MTNQSACIVRCRVEKHSISLVFQSASDKKAKIIEVLEGKGLSLDEVVCIGDDINDIEVMKLVDFFTTVAGGTNMVKESTDCVCSKSFGEGAFWEFAELILGNVCGEKDVK
ncbi:HAD hydrolase family protein [Chloroflexota bacterium]